MVPEQLKFFTTAIDVYAWAPLQTYAKRLPAVNSDVISIWTGDGKSQRWLAMVLQKLVCLNQPGQWATRLRWTADLFSKKTLFYRQKFEKKDTLS